MTDMAMLRWVDAMAARFRATPDAQAHFRIVDDPEVRQRLQWLKKHEKWLYDERLRPVIRASSRLHGGRG
jgi:hypothetical protein